MDESRLFEGIAQGGPRDGVKLSAPGRWGGLVYYNNGKGQMRHNGRYKWDADLNTWVWHGQDR